MTNIVRTDTIVALEGGMGMFHREFNHKRYRIVSKDGFGITIKLLKYQATETWIGFKDDARKAGFVVKGSKGFYQLSDGSVVIKGFLARPTKENNIEISIKKGVNINKNLWNEIRKEVDFLLNYTE